MPRLTGLPSLKIHLRTNQHPCFSFPCLTNNGFLAFCFESLTFTDPSIDNRVSVINVFLIRSFFVFNGSLVGFSFLLLERGCVGFSVCRFIWAIPRDVTLFVAGESAAFCAPLIHIFWGCGASPSLGSAVSICRTVPISSHIHCIWIRRRHLDLQDLGKSAAEKPVNCF